MIVNEKRGAKRVRFESRILIRTDQGNIKATAEARNISLKGIYLQAESMLPIGTWCDIDIGLTGNSSEMFFTVQGRVCRHDEHGMGIAFLDLSMDNFVHIKNLVQLNIKVAEQERGG